VVSVLVVHHFALLLKLFHNFLEVIEVSLGHSGFSLAVAQSNVLASAILAYDRVFATIVKS
jgi:hypothetical protein